MVANAGVGEFMHIDNTLDHGYVECVSVRAIEGKFINGLMNLALETKEAFSDDSDDSFVMDEYGRYRYALHELSANKIINSKPFTTSTKVKYSNNDSNSSGNFIETASLKQVYKPRGSRLGVIYVFGTGAGAMNDMDSVDEAQSTKAKGFKKTKKKVKKTNNSTLVDLTNDLTLPAMTMRQAEIKMESIDNEGGDETSVGDEGDSGL